MSVPHQHNAGSTGRQRRRHQYPLACRHARQQHGARLELHEALLAGKDLHRTRTELHLNWPSPSDSDEARTVFPRIAWMVTTPTGWPFTGLITVLDQAAGAGAAGPRMPIAPGCLGSPGGPRTPHTGRTWWRFRAHRTDWSLPSRGTHGAFDSRVARRPLLAWGACGSLRRNSENSVL